ncbi:TAXI family TRAP transporter solute-binding subunit [Acuticoccus sediminis]|uniref:TAXI family TRAP transporter solute-binding subunit n=1 Tax=Acuticoccus sediminis TaxID=2184697 RepID=UPI001CFEC921|nr:TAXI family TRAP transporter solute-binding subunit [Acuticoccus sediminis]
MTTLKRRLTAGAAAAALLALIAPASAQDMPSSMTIATAAPGGVYAVYGEGLAKIITEEVGIPTSTRQTQGPPQNLILLNGGQTEIAMTTSGPAYESMTGESELAPGVKYEGMRALFAMYPTPFQMIALKSSGITSLEGLDGKRVGSGPRAGTGGTYWVRWLDSMGIDANLQYGSASDQSSQLADGRLDAFILAGGIPHPSFSELETTQDVTIFGMDTATRDKILEANPSAVAFTIPASTYKSVDTPLETAAMWNFVVVDETMPEELAYKITKAVLENNPKLKATHAAAKDTVAENISNDTFIPLHPGAARYYEEIGIAIPDAIKPAD